MASRTIRPSTCAIPQFQFWLKNLIKCIIKVVNVSKSQYYEFRHNIMNLGNQNSKYSWRISDLENPQTGTHFANSVLMYKICKTSFRHSSIPLFRDLHILNVYNMYNLELGVFMYKYSTDDLPTIFKVYFSKRSHIHNRDTRNMTNYNLRKKTEQILHPKKWKHLDLVFGILYQKKSNCLSMSKHLESSWRTTYFSSQ